MTAPRLVDSHLLGHKHSIANSGSPDNSLSGRQSEAQAQEVALDYAKNSGGLLLKVTK